MHLQMPSSVWKVLLTAALLGAIFSSVFLRGPREPIRREELRRLVGAAIVLYGVGALASVSHRGVLAGIVYAAGILVCSLAVWLSRGIDRRDDPGGAGDDPPGDRQPPPGPGDLPRLDWDEFERERARWGSSQPISG